MFRKITVTSVPRDFALTTDNIRRALLELQSVQATIVERYNELHPLLDSLEGGATKRTHKDRKSSPNPWNNGFDGANILTEMAATREEHGGFLWDNLNQRPKTVKQSILDSYFLLGGRLDGVERLIRNLERQRPDPTPYDDTEIKKWIKQIAADTYGQDKAQGAEWLDQDFSGFPVQTGTYSVRDVGDSLVSLVGGGYQHNQTKIVFAAPKHVLSVDAAGTTIYASLEALDSGVETNADAITQLQVDLNLNAAADIALGGDVNQTGTDNAIARWSGDHLIQDSVSGPFGSDAGKFGIGVANAAGIGADLHVDGTVRLESLAQIAAGNVVDIATLDANGNVERVPKADLLNNVGVRAGNLDTGAVLYADPGNLITSSSDGPFVSEGTFGIGVPSSDDIEAALHVNDPSIKFEGLNQILSANVINLLTIDADGNLEKVLKADFLGGGGGGAGNVQHAGNVTPFAVAYGGQANDNIITDADGPFISNSGNFYINFLAANIPAGGAATYALEVNGTTKLQDVLTVVNGGGTITLDSGGILGTSTAVFAEDITSSTGDITATLGDITATLGEITAGTNVSAGGSVAAGVDITAGGDIFAGDAIEAAGEIVTTGGSLTASVGGLTVATDIVSTNGSILAGSGACIVRDNIQTTQGNITALAGSVVASDTLDGLNLKISNAPEQGHVLTCMDVAGNASWQPAQNAVVLGNHCSNVPWRSLPSFGSLGDLAVRFGFDVDEIVDIVNFSDHPDEDTWEQAGAPPYFFGSAPRPNNEFFRYVQTGNTHYNVAQLQGVNCVLLRGVGGFHVEGGNAQAVGDEEADLIADFQGKKDLTVHAIVYPFLQPEEANFEGNAPLDQILARYSSGDDQIDNFNFFFKDESQVPGNLWNRLSYNHTTAAGLSIFRPVETTPPIGGWHLVSMTREWNAGAGLYEVKTFYDGALIDVKQAGGADPFDLSVNQSPHLLLLDGFYGACASIMIATHKQSDDKIASLFEWIARYDCLETPITGGKGSAPAVVEGGMVLEGLPEGGSEVDIFIGGFLDFTTMGSAIDWVGRWSDGASIGDGTPVFQPGSTGNWMASTNNAWGAFASYDPSSESFDSYDFAYSTGSTSHIYASIKSDGKFGIGTTSPNEALHIVSAGNGGVEIESTSGAPSLTFDMPGNEEARILFRENTELRASIVWDSQSPIVNAMIFKGKGTNTEVARIDSAGNLGIGTAAPGDYNDSADNLVVYEEGNGGITIAGTPSDWGCIYFADGASGGATHAGAVCYNHATDKLHFGTNSTDDQITVDSNGMLGIGTTTPGSKLHVTDTTPDVTVVKVAGGDGNFGVVGGNKLTFDREAVNYITCTGSSGAFRVETGGGGNPRLDITSDGKVGIGTTSPATTLDVAGAISATGTSASAPAYTFSGDADTGMYRPTADTIRFTTGGSHAATIDSSGNVGIGTTSPAKTLDVFSSDGNPQLRLSYNAGNFMELGVESNTGNGIIKAAGGTLILDPTNVQVNGSMGIGTGSPAEKLDVTGAVKLGTTSSANAGTIRWTGSDFEGYTGSAWSSLTGYSLRAFVGSGTVAAGDPVQIFGHGSNGITVALYSSSSTSDLPMMGIAKSGASSGSAIEVTVRGVSDAYIMVEYNDLTPGSKLGGSSLDSTALAYVSSPMAGQLVGWLLETVPGNGGSPAKSSSTYKIWVQPG